MDFKREAQAAAARIAPYVRETPVESSSWLSDLSGGDVFLKAENLQWTGSFKIRGATHKLLTLSGEQKKNGVVTASTGNHGLAVARALQTLDCRGTIFLPENAAPMKRAALEAMGADLELYGTDGVQTERFAREQARKRGQLFISPYNDPEVIAGQGSIGVELIRQLGRIDALFVTVGGGGLVAGVGGYLKALFPSTRIVGCWPKNSPVLYRSLEAGRILEMDSDPTLADGSAGGVEAGSITFEMCREIIDDGVLVEEEEIRSALRQVLARHHLLIEGAAAVAVASFLKRQQEFQGQTVVILLCGGNISLDQLRECL